MGTPHSEAALREPQGVIFEVELIRDFQLEILNTGTQPTYYGGNTLNDTHIHAVWVTRVSITRVDPEEFSPSKGNEPSSKYDIGVFFETLKLRH